MPIMFRDVIALAAALCTLCIAPFAAAEVVEITPSGFLVRHDVNVNAAPEASWKALVDVGNWWNSDHSFSGNAANLSIDPRPGGCFCEKLANGGGVSHMTVVFVSPNTVLRMTGGLGPLQGSGLAGSMTWRITPAPPASRIEVFYSVGGYMQGGFDKIAPAVSAVLGEQVNRLKNFIETGKPVAPK
jgi:uncharacterized protein YndB with AHSA1/START domain